MHLFARGVRVFAVLVLLSFEFQLFSQSPSSQSFPWSNTSLSPDERATLVLKEMTLDEKITLLHGTGHRGLGPMSPLASGANGGAGYVVGIDRKSVV